MTTRQRLYAGLIVVAVASVGLLNLPVPFSGDQALFTIGARQLAGGAVPYRDFWDLKQPGIYWFYELAGRCFGFNEVGVHTAELIWLGVTCVVAAVLCRSWHLRPADARHGRDAPATSAESSVSLVAAALTGVYAAVLGPWQLTQLEGLVALPILLAILAARRPTFGRWVAAGAMVAAVAVFKIALVIVPAAAVLAMVFSTGGQTKAVARAILPAAIGFAVVIAPVVTYFASVHQLGLAYRTFFVDPRRIVTELPTSRPIVLLRAVKWFTLIAGPMVVSGFFSLRRWRSSGGVVPAMAAWVVVGLAIILAQRMWWAYHLVLILTPIAILAAFGLIELWHRHRCWAIGLATAIAICSAVPVARKAIAFHRPDHRAYATKLWDGYGLASTEADWFTAHADRGDSVYVLGDPLILYLSNRPQPVAVNGWSPEWFLPEHWDALTDQFRANPPRWLFVATENETLLQTRGIVFRRFLSDHYRTAENRPGGVWYRVTQ